MTSKFTISLAKIIEELSLETIFMAKDPNEVLISSADVNRPGLELTGFLDHFDKQRILVMGNTENSFLSSFSSKQRKVAINRLFALGPPAVILTRNIPPYPEVLTAAEHYRIPILGWQDSSSTLVAAIVSFLSAKLAPRITRSGEMIDVYGEGIFITGDSGIGKSETAIELVNRGHRLISDDVTEICKVSNKHLVGSAPENTRHFVELRGVGFINVRKIFGIGAVKVAQKIDMLISLENWETWSGTQMYDRLGLEDEYTTILGVQIPVTHIPVTTGRNLAIIIEVAAMNHRQKKMGYNAAQEILKKMGYEL